MKNKLNFLWLQIGLLSLVPVFMLLGLLAGESTWAVWGFASIPMFVLAAAAVILGFMRFSQLKNVGKVGLSLFTAGVIINSLLGWYFQTEAGIGSSLALLGFITLPMVPSGYFLWFYDLAKVLKQLRNIGLATAALNLLLYVIAFIFPGNRPMSDSEMANLIVVDGLFLVAIFIGLTAYFVNRRKRN